MSCYSFIYFMFIWHDLFICDISGDCSLRGCETRVSLHCYTYTCNTTRWGRPIGWLICTSLFPQKSSIIVANLQKEIWKISHSIYLRHTSTIDMFHVNLNKLIYAWDARCLLDGNQKN